MMPMSSAAPLSSETARMARPVFVLLIKDVRAIMEIVVTTRVTMVMPEMVTLPRRRDGTLMMDAKGIGVALKISRATFWSR